MTEFAYAAGRACFAAPDARERFEQLLAIQEGETYHAACTSATQILFRARITVLR